jgi:hypothetical protein
MLKPPGVKPLQLTDARSDPLGKIRKLVKSTTAHVSSQSGAHDDDEVIRRRTKIELSETKAKRKRVLKKRKRKLEQMKLFEKRKLLKLRESRTIDASRKKALRTPLADFDDAELDFGALTHGLLTEPLALSGAQATYSREFRVKSDELHAECAGVAVAKTPLSECEIMIEADSDSGHETDISDDLTSLGISEESDYDEYSDASTSLTSHEREERHLGIKEFVPMPMISHDTSRSLEDLDFDEVSECSRRSTPSLASTSSASLNELLEREESLSILRARVDERKDYDDAPTICRYTHFGAQRSTDGTTLMAASQCRLSPLHAMPFVGAASSTPMALIPVALPGGGTAYRPVHMSSFPTPHLHARPHMSGPFPPTTHTTLHAGVYPLMHPHRHGHMEYPLPRSPGHGLMHGITPPSMHAPVMHALSPLSGLPPVPALVAAKTYSSSPRDADFDFSSKPVECTSVSRARLLREHYARKPLPEPRTVHGPRYEEDPLQYAYECDGDKAGDGDASPSPKPMFSKSSWHLDRYM